MLGEIVVLRVIGTVHWCFWNDLLIGNVYKYIWNGPYRTRCLNCKQM